MRSAIADPPVPPEATQPQHVRQSAPISANREKALLSAIWNYAREMGYTAMANPCSGAKGNKEKGRDVYIEDSLYQTVYAKADLDLRDAMDLVYLTGQRPGDTLRQLRGYDGLLLIKFRGVSCPGWRTHSQPRTSEKGHPEACNGIGGQGSPDIARRTRRSLNW